MPAGHALTRRRRHKGDRHDELEVERRNPLLLCSISSANDEVAIGMLFFDQAIVANQPRLHDCKPNGYRLLASLPFVWVDE